MTLDSASPEPEKEALKKTGMKKKMEQLGRLLAAKKAALESGEPSLHASQHAQNCEAVLNDQSLDPRARAEYLILYASEVGLDIQGSLADVIKRLDKTADMEKAIAELTRKVAEHSKKAGPLRPEIFVRRFDGADGPACVALTQTGPMVLPLSPDLDGLEDGDSVLVDSNLGVVAKDGAIVQTGEIVTVEEVPDGGDRLALVKHRDTTVTAHLARSVRESPDLKPGARAVFDASRHFVSRLVTPRLDGSELLAPPSTLSGFDLESLGSPHPVLDEILTQIKQEVEHPDWSRKMQARQRRSYLFHGPTGSGKTCTVKVLVNLVADWTATLTGVREPRVIFAEAAQFLSPWFGESENKIADFFAKLGSVARKEVRTLDGRRIVLPTICVMEEVEGLLRARGEQSSSSHLFDRVVSVFLEKLDSTNNSLDAPLLFIATTNFPSLLDPAAKRRIGSREVRFGTLDARGALAVLEKKIPSGMPICRKNGENAETARTKLLRAALFFLFGDMDDQAIAEATLQNGSRIRIHRRDVITGAHLETAVSQSIDRALVRSVGPGRLLGLDAMTVVEALDKQLTAMAESMTRHNVADSAPDLFDGSDGLMITDVKPVKRAGRRPLAYFVF